MHGDLRVHDDEEEVIRCQRAAESWVAGARHVARRVRFVEGRDAPRITVTARATLRRRRILPPLLIVTLLIATMALLSALMRRQNEKLVNNPIFGMTRDCSPPVGPVRDCISAIKLPPTAKRWLRA